MRGHLRLAAWMADRAAHDGGRRVAASDVRQCAVRLAHYAQMVRLGMAPQSEQLLADAYCVLAASDDLVDLRSMVLRSGGANG